MLNFPLDLRFKIVAIAPQITVTDATGKIICYVKQTAFKLKEAVTVFSDASRSTPLYRIAADRVLDISANYHIEDVAGRPLGTVRRHGMRSIWRAHYEIHREGRPAYLVREENPWIKLADGLVGQIPILGMLSGYLLHPAYRVTRGEGGESVLRAVKRAALFEGKYQIERLGSATEEEERLILLGLLMMILLERSRG